MREPAIGSSAPLIEMLEERRLISGSLHQRHLHQIHKRHLLHQAHRLPPIVATGTTIDPTGVSPTELSSYPTGAGPATVTVGADGKLAYTYDTNGDRIMDFSECGYGGGGVAIPN